MSEPVDEVPAVVQAGEGIGNDQPLQLALDGEHAVMHLLHAQQRAHAGEQLVRVAGQRQVIVRALLQAQHPLGRGAAVARDEHRHELVVHALELREEIEPVHVWQRAPQHHQVGRALAKLLQRLGAAPRRRDRQLSTREQVALRGASALVGLHHEHPHRPSRPRDADVR